MTTPFRSPTSRAAGTAALVAAIAIAMAVVGPALDDPYESAAEVAASAHAIGLTDGEARLLALCRAKHGPQAGYEWTPAGPACRLFAGRSVSAATSTVRVAL
jgi:hypothetical protein